ncbi:hypothetical protein LTR05_003761 [Lithohypha guttulata]|uniref:Uncharacterized protein n=1 Tax=Lithohypha guttulata TaxID=1690604 RepID=A0AAN7Y6R0_9EURO|nr:hypothetical protein LTR05_003761 [Lithohypha guttulata]
MEARTSPALAGGRSTSSSSLSPQWPGKKPDSTRPYTDSATLRRKPASNSKNPNQKKKAAQKFDVKEASTETDGSHEEVADKDEGEQRSTMEPDAYLDDDMMLGSRPRRSYRMSKQLDDEEKDYVYEPEEKPEPVTWNKQQQSQPIASDVVEASDWSPPPTDLATHVPFASGEDPKPRSAHGQYNPQKRLPRRPRMAERRRAVSEERGRQSKPPDPIQRFPVVDLTTVNGRKLKELQTLVDREEDPEQQDYDQAWILFISLENQEEVARLLFSYLCRSRDSKQLTRAREAFRLIPNESRDEQIYASVIKIELERFQHENAISLAIDGTIQGHDLVPDLLAQFVDHGSWNAAAELMRRNLFARRDMPNLNYWSLSGQKHSAALLPLSRLVEKCRGIRDLDAKVLSLTRRLQNEDATLYEHRRELQVLRQQLAMACVSSSSVMAAISPSRLLALFDLQKDFGNWKLHTTALNTLHKLPDVQPPVELALMTYRNLRSTLPHEPVRPSMLGILISMCGRANYSLHIYDYIFSEFTQHFGRPASTAILRAMTACARQGDLTAISRYLALWQEGHKDQIPPIDFLSPFIYACAMNADPVQARQHFDRIKQDFGLIPNTICWNILLLAHARSTDDISAFAVFQEMRTAKVPADSYTYGTLLSICNAHTDTETSLSLLSDARQQGVHVTVPMVDTVVNTLLANDEVEAAYRFALVTTESNKPKSLTRLWNSFVKYFSAKGDVNQLSRVRTIMTKFGIKANEATYATLILTLTLKERTQEAVELLREMRRDKKLAVTPFHYSIVLHGFVREHNRDMAQVVFSEMKQQFQTVPAEAVKAMLRLQTQRSLSNARDRELDVTYLMDALTNLESDDGSTSNLDDTSNRPRDVSTTIMMYFTTVIRTLLGGEKYTAAELLVEDLKKRMSSLPHGPQLLESSMAVSLIEMDLAIASSKYHKVGEIWKAVFKRARQSRLPLALSQDSSHPGGLRKEKTGTISKAESVSLSKPLNRYIDAMSYAGRVSSLATFINNHFLPAGYQLTSYNWNRYVQALCRSTETKHHLRAFVLAEHSMNRVQSWTLLIRGLLRRKNTSWVFDKLAEDLPRPILRKKNEYFTSSRREMMDVDPLRIIPTYTTMVHLGAVLSMAQEKAQNHDPSELSAIRDSAAEVKKFLERMPYLKDSIQGSILRGLEDSGDLRPRPRSEESIRAKVDRSGILGGDSVLDDLSADFSRDIEDLFQRFDDIRKLPSQGADTGADDYAREVALAEEMTGQITRAPIVLAGRGRFETEMETLRRVRKEEAEKLSTLRSMLQTLQDQTTPSEIDLVSPVGPPSEVTEHHRRPEDQPSRSLSFSLPPEEPRTKPLLPSDSERASSRRSATSELSSPSVNKKVSVLEQLKSLDRVAQEKATKLASRVRSTRARLAIPYAAIRRIRGRRAAVQRATADQRLATSIANGNISPRALTIRSGAMKRAIASALARRRRASYLEYEADLKKGIRLPPFPRNEEAYRRHRRKYGQVRVRFIADLNRKRALNLVRRGIIAEKRKPAITGKVDQSQFTAEPQNRHLVLQRPRTLPLVRLTSDDSGPPEKTHKQLVRTRFRGTSYRRVLKKRLALRRAHLQNRVVNALGQEVYEKKIEELRGGPRFEPFR